VGVLVVFFRFFATYPLKVKKKSCTELDDTKRFILCFGRWFMKYQHVDPEEAVRIHIDVQAKKSVAIHWGTFALANEVSLNTLRELRFPEYAFINEAFLLQFNLCICRCILKM